MIIDASSSLIPVEASAAMESSSLISVVASAATDSSFGGITRHPPPDAATRRDATSTRSEDASSSGLVAASAWDAVAVSLSHAACTANDDCRDLVGTAGVTLGASAILFVALALAMLSVTAPPWLKLVVRASEVVFMVCVSSVASNSVTEMASVRLSGWPTPLLSTLRGVPGTSGSEINGLTVHPVRASAATNSSFGGITRHPPPDAATRRDATSTRSSRATRSTFWALPRISTSSHSPLSVSSSTNECA